MKVRKALIPAAGLGTRFLPATKVVPKELLPIVDRPAIEYIVEELVRSGIEEIVFVISPEKESIGHHFQKTGYVEGELLKRNKMNLLESLHRLIDKARFRLAYQNEALGLGHAVLCGSKEIGNEPFVVVLPDDLVKSETPCAKQLIDLFDQEKCSVLAVEKVARDQVSSYGIVAGKESQPKGFFKIDSIVEKPPIDKAPSQWAIIGRYVLVPEIFSALSKVKPGALGEIQLTDALQLLAANEGLLATPFEGLRLDVGQPKGFVHANLVYGMERPEISRFLNEGMKKK